MKRIITTCIALVAMGQTFAQKDSTSQAEPDTIKVGNYVIVKKNQPKKSISISSSTDDLVNIKYDNGKDKKKKKPSHISTNWWIMDIGFANFDDKTVYGSADANSYLKTIRPGEAAFTANDLKLRTTKSTNVNLWFFMQKLNVSKGVLNLKYGLGLEMFNYRYENNISYNNKPTSYIFRDSVDFSKNKLYASYLTVPFMININTTPGKKNGLSISAGVSAGYLMNSRNKQISDERGKRKNQGDFDLEKFRLAYIGELGLGPVRLFGSYSVNPMHENGLKQHPYSFGVRFSNW